MAKVKVREKDVQRAICDYLSLKKLFYIRMNTGAVTATYNGKQRFFRFGEKGMADIYVRKLTQVGPYRYQRTIWVEVKSPTGRQSEDQQEFQKRVEALGDLYILARSIDDVRGVVG